MTGAFSGHLLDSFEATNQPRAPFGQFGQVNISTHGAMSFNSQIHGTQHVNNSPSLPQEISDVTTNKINALQAKLNQKLGPEYISQRPGPGGGKLTYAEGWKIINLANEVFGFNGWSSNVVNLTTDYIDFSEESKKFNVGVTAIVRVTLRDGVFHEDIGYGILENSKSKGAALDKCKKEAVTDALKRSLRNFGNLLGNCLYDKSYTQEIVKIKVPAAKFDKSQLHRRPEFDEPKQQSAAGPSTSTMTSVVKMEPAAKPLSSLPPHMRPGGMPNAKPNTSHNTPPPPYNPNPPRANPAAQLQTPVRARHQPQHSQQISPQQQHKPPQKVTFASPTRDADESFSYSDDDAFLAQVDLGEGDIGRPIDYGEGTGDVSASASTIVNRSDLSVGCDSVKGSMDTGARGSMGPPASRNGQPNAYLQTGQAHIQQRQDAASTSSSHPSNLHTRVHNQNLNSSSVNSHIHSAPNSNPSTSHFQNQNSNSNPAGPASRQTDVAPSPMTRQQQPRLAQPNLMKSSSGQNNAGTGSSPIQNQNQAPHLNANTRVNANVPSKKPVAPSMGGFHFPPGMNPHSTSQHPPAQRGPSPSASTPTFSLKRSADAMNAPSIGSRRPVQGMGLAQQQQQAASVKREPFTRLEIGEGGDVKRMKL